MAKAATRPAAAIKIEPSEYETALAPLLEPPPEPLPELLFELLFESLLLSEPELFLPEDGAADEVAGWIEAMPFMIELVVIQFDDFGSDWAI